MNIKSIIHRIAHRPVIFSILALAFSVFLAGCETNSPHLPPVPGASAQGSNDIVLKEADSLKINFPGNDNLNTTQTIRIDGKITLPMVGEVVAAGKTPAQLQKELIDLYSTQLVSAKQITVTVQSSSYYVFVTGAVVKPGKVACDHPMTVLEAIMEIGGFDYDRANLKAVRVIRTQNGKTYNYKVNLEGVVKSGVQLDVFYVQRNDYIYVPSKITWF